MKVLQTVCAWGAVAATTMGGAAWAQTGRLAYVTDNGAYIAPANGKGRAIRLPQSERASAAALSPDGKTVVYAAPPPASSSGGAAETAKRRVSGAPFREARELVAPLALESYAAPVWSPNGKTLYLTNNGGEKMWAYDAATGRITPQPALTHSVISLSADNGVWAYLGASDVRVRFGASGKEKILAASGRPAPLFAALKRARNPEGLKDLTESLSEGMGQRSSRDWSFGTPALTPNGKTAFFACNMGSGLGASGNTTFCFFAADIATGKLSVLSKVGAFFGRVPYDTQVSPDGARLLFSTSQHDSAFNNPSQVYVVTLETQRKRELLYGSPQDKPESDDGNVLNGVCWSPDGKYVAASVTFYRVAKLIEEARKNPDADDLSSLKTGTLNLYDVRTGRIVRRIKGAREPSWGK